MLLGSRDWEWQDGSLFLADNPDSPGDKEDEERGRGWRGRGERGGGCFQ